MRSTLTVRSGSSRQMAVAAWVACAVILVAIAINGGLAELVAYGAVPLALAALAWAVFWEPCARVDADGVTLANVWRTVTVPWSALESVDTRWGLRLHVGRRRYSSWAVPARSRYRRSRAPRDEPDLLEIPDDVERTVSADSDQIGRVIETRLLAGASSGEDAVRTSWNTRSIAVVVASVALAALTVAVLG